ncbi:hypothetical protein [Pseudomonas sp. CBC3]|uniref:hypothetical protein n=1 Tax=Pseudomonas sp. CBC3 TaxID=3123318 RepID=UPI0030E89E3E
MSDVYFINGHLSGEIHGDRKKRFRDATRIMSSPVNFGFQALGHQLFLTQSGNLYMIASWRRFDEPLSNLDFSDGIHPVDFVFSIDPDRQRDFESDIEVAGQDEVKLIRVGLPNQRRHRAVTVQEDTVSTSEKPMIDRNFEIFQQALGKVELSKLQRTLESARDEFMEQEGTQVLIECTKRRPDPSLLTLVSLGYLPEWQSILVLDGQFNVSQSATNHLAIALLVVLPAEALNDELRDLRFQIDLGI